MYFKLAHILSGIFFLATSICSAKTDCTPGNQCKLLSSCPEMVNLKESGNPESIQIVRNNRCGPVEGKIKVCCPNPLISLLPSKCGTLAPEHKLLYENPFFMGAHPWIAAIGYTGPKDSKVSFKCAGAIISEKYVLTSANCLDPMELGNRKLSVIHLGDYNLATERDCVQTWIGDKCFTPHIVAGVENTVSHPMYNKRGKYSDNIGLIRLDTTLNFDSNLVTIEPVCLPPNGFNFKTFAGNRAPVAAGWGLVEKGKNSGISFRATVSIPDDALCKERHGENFVGNQLCIMENEEVFRRCISDPGSPLVMSGRHGPPFFLVGIFSFGPYPCGIKNFPDVYTNVADYRNWIIENMRP